MSCSKKKVILKQIQRRGLRIVYNNLFMFLEEQQTRGISVRCKPKNTLSTENIFGGNCLFYENHFVLFIYLFIYLFKSLITVCIQK